MKKIKIQISEDQKSWSETPKTEMQFKNDNDLILFCYRLATVTGKEVRSEEHQNGTYYHPTQAKRYFNN
jgi:hypothetical protein